MTHLTQSPSVLYLWKRRSLYIGKYAERIPLTQGASSLVISLDGPITLEVPSTSTIISTRSALIPAGLTFRPDTHGQRIANCYLDPYNEDFFKLKQIMGTQRGGIYINSQTEIVQAAALEKMLCHKLDQTQANALLNSAVFPSPKAAPKHRPTDQRIIDTIAFIQDEPSINHSNKTLADRVNVSEVTLQRLFKSTTGIPIRRFRLWHRLFVTSTLMAFGWSITEAALEAGFSDASHFNHVFKDMFGIRPSLMLSRSQYMSIFVDAKSLRNHVASITPAAIDIHKA